MRLFTESVSRSTSNGAGSSRNRLAVVTRPSSCRWRLSSRVNEAYCHVVPNATRPLPDVTARSTNEGPKLVRRPFERPERWIEAVGEARGRGARRQRGQRDEQRLPKRRAGGFGGRAILDEVAGLHRLVRHQQVDDVSDRRHLRRRGRGTPVAAAGRPSSTSRHGPRADYLTNSISVASTVPSEVSRPRTMTVSPFFSFGQLPPLKFGGAVRPRRSGPRA